MTIIVIVAIFLGAILSGYLGASLYEHAHGRALSEEEAETDRFLADLGVTYREDLARKIADECDYQINEFEDRLELIDFRGLVLKAALDVLGEKPKTSRSELCGHIGYPFGEPPSMFCDLPIEHAGDHMSRGYNHSEIAENRKQMNLS